MLNNTFIIARVKFIRVGVILSIRGFSLFEMLICLMIMSIFIMGGSIFGVKYKYYELESIASEISSAVRAAKFLAIIRGEKLTLKCRQVNDCSQGLVLYSENIESMAIESKKEIIKQWCWPHNINKIIWHGFKSNNELNFMPDIKHNAANGKFNLFYNDKLYIALIVNRLGKVRMVKSMK